MVKPTSPILAGSEVDSGAARRFAKPSVAIVEDTEAFLESFYAPRVTLPKNLDETWKVRIPEFPGETLGTTSEARLNWLVRDFCLSADPSGEDVIMEAGLTLIRAAMQTEDENGRSYLHGRPSEFRKDKMVVVMDSDPDPELDDEDFEAGKSL